MISPGSNIKYILNQDAPVLRFKGLNLENSGEMLSKGTVLEGDITEKLVREPRTKENYFIMVLRVGKTKDFVPAGVLNVFIDKYAQTNGMLKRDQRLNSNIHSRGWKHTALKYGLPLLTGTLGYIVAKKRGFGTAGKLFMTLGFIAAGTIPYFISRERPARSERVQSKAKRKK